MILCTFLPISHCKEKVSPKTVTDECFQALITVNYSMTSYRNTSKDLNSYPQNAILENKRRQENVTAGEIIWLSRQRQ